MVLVVSCRTFWLAAEMTSAIHANVFRYYLLGIILRKSKFTLIAGAVIAAVVVGCGGYTYTTVGGTVTGLGNASALTLVTAQGFSETLTEDGKFSFKIASNQSYAIATTQTDALSGGQDVPIWIDSQPNQVNCTAPKVTGKMSSDTPVTNLAVTCVPNVPLFIAFAGVTANKMPAEYAATDTEKKTDLNAPYLQLANVSVSLSLVPNPTTVAAGRPSYAPDAEGGLAVPTYLVNGTDYQILVSSQPRGEMCTVKNGTGKANSAVTPVINDIRVDCVKAVPVAGTVLGLEAGDSVILTVNNDAAYRVTAGKTSAADPEPFPFRFPTSVLDGVTYNVSVNTQPIGKTCTVANGAGVASTATDDSRKAISNVVVTCQKST
jgi:hypothetical protein